MSESFNKPHLKIQGFSENQNYSYPQSVVSKMKHKSRNRFSHGNNILQKLNHLKERFNLSKEIELPYEELQKDDVIYVQFYSAWDFKFDFDQFTDNRFGIYQLLNIQKEINSENQERFKILVLLKEGGIKSFIKKIEQYLDPDKNTNKGNPKNEKLFVNIDDIKLATLEAFWTDGSTHTFPEKEQEVWWEVWLRNVDGVETKAIEQLRVIGAQLGESRLEFKENIVRLVKATANQLSSSLLFLDSLSELRKPQVLNDFITHEDITYENKKEWLNDLLNRTRINLNFDDDDVLVSLFDSGVNNVHPLLEQIVPDNYLETWKSHWGKGDTEPNGGHGTGMAGLILYGNLTDALASPYNIDIFHGVESFKVCHPSERTDPQLYGALYEYGFNSLFAIRPYNKRVFCLAITNDGIIKSGRPSSGSSKLDEIIFGSLYNDIDPQLFIVSGGNVVLQKPTDYPDQNFITSIQDPGQAYNALTVGAYTLMTALSKGKFTPIADSCAMSPFNTTSAAWETQWPNKPDIVFEGGNMIIDQFGTLSSHEELSPVSLDSDFKSDLFTPFNGTSCASALVSKMAAELRKAYPDYWPETIRGLLVHSANWTDQMLKDFKLNNENDRRALIRSVGYGVPNLINAKNSANNSLTMIAEEYIKPYKLDGAKPKYNNFHLFKLPWPENVLLHEVNDSKAKITVTLSYFIEPNPGGKEYSRSFSYHSHELEFKLIKPGETLEEFHRRVSSAADNNEEENEKPNLKGEDWTIKERIRSKGSIKKDYLETTGAELSDRYYLAVFPKNGWYKTRKKLGKYENEVRYSLIVSIETIKQDVDLYTPIENIVKTLIPSNPN